MPELILPDSFSRLKSCADVIRVKGDEYDSVASATSMARLAINAILPELQGWIGRRIDVYTDTAYSEQPNGGYSRVAGSDLFGVVAKFTGPALRENITPLSDDLAVSDIELCLEFQPQIEAYRINLEAAHAIQVPVVALRDLEIVS